ncbi:MULTISPECIES: HNH endonuclease [unclassified Rhizobium]|uniref:HNH endonuclease n=1 Tax=unclassified Rhizobium TaxID=2613769 RepID=UPI001ADD0C8A|nr:MULTISPECIES: NUMOD4 motif-containing HNH endonuclease [unclassified Rhizobium]MBO9099449.1 HNH endonuclease [Rhizobium sp. L58/93]QXZ87066.1 HNH endonuclease [Rhizobium sp. K1/93]QXZ92900.1 HNH endonuclease [Rhizobium sp. K15/93]
MLEWRPVAGFEDYYSISNEGNVVRTLTRYGRPIWKPCKPTDRRGYDGFALCVENIVTWVSGHREVWKAFEGPIPEDAEINHINGIKTDNKLSNLELCSRSENAVHASRVLGRFQGERQWAAVLNEQDVRDIRELYAKGNISQQKLADQYGVIQITISRAIRGANWSHVK